MKKATPLFALLTILFVFLLFKVKYEVLAVEQNIRECRALIAKEKDHIHILKAEWTHLNDPKRLQKLAEKHLGSTPTKTEQIIAIRSVPNTPRYDSGRHQPEVHLTSIKD